MTVEDLMFEKDLLKRVIENLKLELDDLPIDSKLRTEMFKTIWQLHGTLMIVLKKIFVVSELKLTQLIDEPSLPFNNVIIRRFATIT